MSVIPSEIQSSELTMPEDPFLHIDTVTIDYNTHGRPSVRAVEDCSLAVGREEKVAILGPSGCGKSTLLAAVAGFLTASSGRIAVAGEVITRPSMDRLMVFQGFDQLLPWKTTAGNIAFGLRERWPKMSREERRRLSVEYAERVGLAQQVNQYPHTLSGGQKQRVSIARAFAMKPDMLLMDEPFGALDAINRERMQDELNSLWNEQPRTILFVTHDVHEAMRIGHRIMVMTGSPGRVATIVDNPFEGGDLSSEPTEAAQLLEELTELLR